MSYDQCRVLADKLIAEGVTDAREAGRRAWAELGDGVGMLSVIIVVREVTKKSLGEAKAIAYRTMPAAYAQKDRPTHRRVFSVKPFDVVVELPYGFANYGPEALIEATSASEAAERWGVFARGVPALWPPGVQFRNVRVTDLVDDRIHEGTISYDENRFAESP